jgi:hypothetical protein
MRRVITLGLLAALACLTLPAAASAAKSPFVKYRVQIQATQKTDWTKPVKVRDRDCFNRPWSKGSGGESVTMKGAATVYVDRLGEFTGFTYDSPNYGPSGKQGIRSARPRRAATTACTARFPGRAAAAGRRSASRTSATTRSAATSASCASGAAGSSSTRRLPAPRSR